MHVLERPGSLVTTARRTPGWLRHRWVIDGSVVVVFGVFAVVGTLEAVQEGGAGRRPLDGVAWALLAVATASLAARRWRPGAVVLVTSAVIAVTVARGYPTGPVWVAPLIALYTAAATGRRALAMTAGAGLMAVPVLWALLARESGTPAEVGAAVLLVALFLAAGEVTRGRRDYLAEVELRASDAERTREETARRRANEERLHLARDLHDITAHTISVIAIQASVAEEALAAPDPCLDGASDAVRAIRTASRQAVAELRATVSTLRDGTAPRHPAPGLDQLDDLLGPARDAGLRVVLAATGTGPSLPPAIDLTAYRIVQESLTNVLRHAQATSVTVRIRREADALEVQVDDDGEHAPGASPSPAGHGLTVMVERAAAVGGHLRAGPKEPSGFLVHARLPVGGNGP